MKIANTSSSHRLASTARIMLLSFVASFSVLACSQLIQWFVYDDWLHETGPLHIAGGAIAAIITFMFIYRWQATTRERQREMLRRFETIAQMNDRIRNALQVIACATYTSLPDATEHVREAVASIDKTLQGVVVEAKLGVSGADRDKGAAAST